MSRPLHHRLARAFFKVFGPGEGGQPPPYATTEELADYARTRHEAAEQQPPPTPGPPAR